MIIEALSCVKDIKIEWIHFGGGEKEDEIKKLAIEKLKGNISFIFKGMVPNQAVLEYYRNTDVDLFINLSESEGIPVSIMEAMSFGIPCIATDVGGTREIVKDCYNGWLMNDGYSTLDVVSAILQYNSLPMEGRMELRSYARNYWNEHYNADKNYRSFVKELIS